MNKNDVRIGMKVVPFQKTVKNWDEKEYGLWAMNKTGYMYVTGTQDVDEDSCIESPCFILNNLIDRDRDEKLGFPDGDFYNTEDFNLYVE